MNFEAGIALNGVFWRSHTGGRPGQCRHREGGYGGNLEQVQELKPPIIVPEAVC